MPSHNDAFHRPKPKQVSEAHLVWYPADGSGEWLEVTEDLEPWERVKAGQEKARQKRTRKMQERAAEYQTKITELRKLYPRLPHWELAQIVAEEYTPTRDPGTIFKLTTFPPEQR